ncbi:MAG: 1-(5-phosphoribosyl)-5-[(5-phosphoribosylamino)methylideneamino]imidazole-4-carboxamide isomerase [Candidatus Bathyarchaeia archaeon]
MEIIPAIDLMNGKVVRLTRGDPKAVKAYDRLGDPITVAKRWESEGADAIHVVDLDAALGRGSNTELIENIIHVVDIPTQVGGGIRKMEAAQGLLRTGAYRVILGVLAFNEPHSVIKLLRDFGSERVVVALDHRNGKVMVQGWKVSTKLSVEEAILKFLKLEAKRFLITSIAKDGTLKGPDYDTLARACSYAGVSIIAAGGVASLEDLATLKQIGVEGVVIGKALYEGMLELKDALRIARRGGRPWL